MPLSKIQTEVLRLLAAQRDPESYIAGARPRRIEPLISALSAEIVIAFAAE